MAKSHPNTEEEWRVIDFAPSYSVSNMGRVRSFKWGNTRILKGSHHKGYHRVSFVIRGKKKDFSAHILVLTAFVGSCPDGMEACHRNGIRDDNRLINLHWDTHANNMREADEDGLMPMRGLLKGTDISVHRYVFAGKKLQVEQVKEIRAKWIPRKYSKARLAREYGVTLSMIQKILMYKSWAWVE